MSAEVGVTMKLVEMLVVFRHHDSNTFM
jgi:hypothetical protein